MYKIVHLSGSELFVRFEYCIKLLARLTFQCYSKSGQDQILPQIQFRQEFAQAAIPKAITAS